MFPSSIFENPLCAVIKEFVSGQMNISEFIIRYNQSDDLSDYLDLIVRYIET